MAYGLLNTGFNKKNQALRGLEKSASDENQRNIQNERLDQAESQAKKTNAGTGAATGAMVGANMASGVAGASVGLSALATGGVGLAAGLLLSELF